MAFTGQPHMGGYAKFALNAQPRTYSCSCFAHQREPKVARVSHVCVEARLVEGQVVGSGHKTERHAPMCGMLAGVVQCLDRDPVERLLNIESTNPLETSIMNASEVENG